MTEGSSADEVSAAIKGLLDDFGRLKRDVAALKKKYEEIDGLAKATARIDQKVDDLARSARDAIAEAKETRSTVSKLTDTVNRDQAIRAARDELAERQRELDTEFAAHEDVRRFARTIIRSVSAGTLDATVLLAELQRRTLDVPGYWLSPACLAFTRWASDDRERYEAAIRLALNADTGDADDEARAGRARTALFMALILRPYARGDAIRQWIVAHLSALRPRSLPPEFQVIIQGITRGVLGDVSARVLYEQMNRWYRDETRSRGDAAQALATWRDRLAGLGTPPDAGQFPVLSRSDEAWKALARRHEATTALTAAAEYFPGRFSAATSAPADLTEQVNAALRALVDTPVPEEARIRQRARWLKAFIAGEADRDAADELIAAEEKTLGRDQDIVMLVRDHAFPDRPGGTAPGPTVTELLAIWMSAQLISRAADRLSTDSPRPRDVTVLVGPPQRPGGQPRSVMLSCSTDASVTDEAIDVQVAAREKGLRDAIASQAEQRQRGWRRATWASRAALPAAAALGATAAFPTGDPRIDFIAPAVLLAVPSIGWLAWLPGQRKRLARSAREETDQATADIRAAGEELKVLSAQERAGQEQLATLSDYLRQLGPADVEKATQAIRDGGRPRPGRPGGLPAWTPLPPARHPDAGGLVPAGEADDLEDL